MHALTFCDRCDGWAPYYTNIANNEFCDNFIRPMHPDQIEMRNNELGPDATLPWVRP